MSQYEVVKAASTEDALKNSAFQVGDLVRVDEVVASANGDRTYTVRVSGFVKFVDDQFVGFLKQIDWMNKTFNTGFSEKPTLLPDQRVTDFHRIIGEEVDELLESLSAPNNLAKITAIADTLGDIIVYCTSESRRWGIPIHAVLGQIMASQASKLVDGKPIYNEEKTKFIKGPDYKAPEKQIENVLLYYGFDESCC